MRVKGRGYRCLRCGDTTMEGHGRRKYCDLCYELELKEDFYKTISNGLDYLFRKNFSSKSKFTAIQHIKYFTRNSNKYEITDWHSMLSHYNVYDDFLNKIVEYYKLWKDMKSNGHKGGFIKTFNFIAQEDISKIGSRNISKLAGFRPMTPERQDYIDEMNRLRKELGRFPTHREIDSGNYSVCGFKGHFGHDELHGVSGVIFNMYGEDAYNEYNDQERLRRIVTKPKEYKKIISDEELMRRFNEFVDGYFKEHGNLPSHRLFEKECKTATKTYRERFGKSWSELLRDKGFTNEQIYSNNRSEIQCLNKIAEILNCDYDHQKRFDWLIGNNNSPLFLDGYYTEYDLCVEFNGRQHYVYVEGKFGTYESFLNQQANDRTKETLCKKNCKYFLIIKSSSPWHKSDWLTKQLTSLGINIPNKN